MRMIIPLVVLSFLIGGGYAWRNSGQSFQMPFPSVITVVDSRYIPTVPESQIVKFPRLFPGELYHQLSMTPTLSVGDVVEIDMTSAMITDWARTPRSFRVSIAVNSDVSSTHFFYLDRNIPKNAQKVTLRITSNNYKPAEAFHQNDDQNGHWFWLREFYAASVIEIS